MSNKRTRCDSPEYDIKLSKHPPPVPFEATGLEVNTITCGEGRYTIPVGGFVFSLIVLEDGLFDISTKKPSKYNVLDLTKTPLHHNIFTYQGASSSAHHLYIMCENATSVSLYKTNFKIVSNTVQQFVIFQKDVTHQKTIQKKYMQSSMFIPIFYATPGEPKAIPPPQ